MKITQLELRNVKSYGASTQIRFTAGVNAICGPNGAGKSTILEAIGFALFDELPYKQSQFLREGEKRGEIVVNLISPLDDREYQVVRPIGGGTPYIHDPRIKRRLATGKADTVDWLREHLGIDPTADSRSLFRDAVGVPQGALTASFLETRARVRKATFDPLLQVDDYAAAWEKLRDTTNHVRDLRHEWETRIAELTAKLERLPGLEQEAKQLQTQTAADRASKLIVVTRLTEAQEQLRDLDAQNRRIDGLTSRLEGERGRLGQLSHRLADARSGVEEARKAQMVVESSRMGHQAYETAQRHLNELETQRQERDSLQAVFSETARNIALVDQVIASRVETLALIDRSEARLAVLAPLVVQQGQLESDLREAERDVNRWEERQTRLADEERRAEKLEQEMEELRSGLIERAALEAKEEELSVEYQLLGKDLAEEQSRLSSREKTVPQIVAELQTAEKAEWKRDQVQTRLREEKNRLEDMVANLEHMRKGCERRQDVAASLSELGQVLRERDAMLSDSVRDEALFYEKNRSLDERMALLEQTEAAQCPVCQQPLTAEKAQDLAGCYQVEKQALREQLNAVQENQRGLENGITVLRTRETELKLEFDALPHPDQEAELVLKIDEQRAKVDELQLEIVPHADASDIASNLRERHRALVAETEVSRQKRQGLNAQRAAIDGELAALRARIPRLPHPDRQEELTADINAQHERIDACREQVRALAAAPDRVVDRRNQLETLGEPRNEQQRLMADVEKRPATEQELVEAQERKQQLEATRAEASDSLEVFAGLDESLAEQQAIREAFEVDHNQYLRNQRAAQSVLERQTRLSELQAEKELVEIETARIGRELETEKAGYDRAHHSALEAEHDRLAREDASLSERLRLEENRLESVKVEIQDLEQRREELVAAEQEQTELTELGAAVRFIRETIRQTGPYVTRRLVQAISFEADRIYGDVIADHGMRLAWDEDYAITVESRGERRSLQQLSGGEQMAAALAVRLALLREMSSVDIAFFDEPTANLDDERRQNLAEQITGIRGFSQLFVISHDDTFEQDTQHVVYVRKENGVSRVEVR